MPSTKSTPSSQIAARDTSCVVPFVILVLVAMPALSGGAQRTAEGERRAEQRERRAARYERAWKAQGSRAIPSLIEIACGNQASALDLVDHASFALAEHGGAAARAVYRYRGGCGRTDGRYRHQLLARVYCEMADPYQEPSRGDEAALVRWAEAVVNEEHVNHALALAALQEVLAYEGMSKCSKDIYLPMLPVLTEAVRHIEGQSDDNAVGTRAGKHHQAAIKALAETKTKEAITTLIAKYEVSDLPTKLIIIDALPRSGPLGAAAMTQAIALLQLTRDDEANVAALRALASFEVSLDRERADLVGKVVAPLLGRVRSAEAGGSWGSGSRQDEWARLGSTVGTEILARAAVGKGSEARRALLLALATPLVDHLRKDAARHLRLDEKALSLPQRRCVIDTLTLQPASGGSLASLSNGNHDANANHSGEREVTRTPPASCPATIADDA